MPGILPLWEGKGVLYLSLALFRPEHGTIDIMVFRRVVFRPQYSTRIALVTSRPSLPAGAIPALVSPGINRGWEDGTNHVSEKCIGERLWRELTGLLLWGSKNLQSFNIFKTNDAGVRVLRSPFQFSMNA